MVYAEGTSVREGRDEAVTAVTSIARLIKPTLGPNGTDVLITTPFGEIYTTNDGATILREVPITHPAARIAADIALTQERSVGDGTTSSVVLAANLLEHLTPLIKTIGLRAVLSGLDEAQARIEAIITENEKPLRDEDLTSIVLTALSGKGGEAHAPLIAQLVIDATPSADAHVTLIERPGKPMRESERVDGIVIDHQPVRDDMPRSSSGKLMLLSGALEPAQASGVTISSAAEAERFFTHEDEGAQSIADAIIESGASLVISRKGVDDRIALLLARAGVTALRRVPLETLETIARVSGARITPKPSSELGDYRTAHVRGSTTIIEGFEHPASTIILCGSTEHVAAELARAAHDAHGVVRAARESGRVVGGAILIEGLAARMDGAPVDKAVAKAFEGLARSIGGLPKPGRGYDVRIMSDVDAFAAGIIEPSDVKRGVVSSAFEITKTIIRIETIVTLPDVERRGTLQI